MRFNDGMLLLYAVTDKAWTGKQTLCEQIEDALQGGATLVQLREKDMDEASLVALAKEVKKVCAEYGVPLIVNDNVDAAVKSGADGVHVGIEDESVEKIRSRVGKGFIIGATAKTVEQARAAESAGADYIGVGAVFPSPTKRKAVRITKDSLLEICSSVSIPAVAIGGISADNVMEIAGSGVKGIAAVSAIFAAEDIKLAAQELKAAAERIVNGQGDKK